MYFMVIVVPYHMRHGEDLDYILILGDGHPYCCGIFQCHVTDDTGG
jgi:hypothetical protein